VIVEIAPEIGPIVEISPEVIVEISPEIKAEQDNEDLIQARIKDPLDDPGTIVEIAPELGPIVEISPEIQAEREQKTNPFTGPQEKVAPRKRRTVSMTGRPRTSTYRAPKEANPLENVSPEFHA